MTIVNSNEQDIPEIFRLYKLATDFQKIKFPSNLWPKFERSLIETEVEEARQFKLLIENKIACIWAITFSDPQIWEVHLVIRKFGKVVKMTRLFTFIE